MYPSVRSCRWFFIQTNFKSNFSVQKRSQGISKGSRSLRGQEVLTRGHEIFDLDMKSNSSDAVSEWAGWNLAHLEFGVSVNPIQTRGADYVHCITACPRGFENLTASLNST